jgi:outer membrane protein OmpA-like peptidoglycan-associated protein
VALAAAVAVGLAAASAAGAQRAERLPALDVALPAADVATVSATLDDSMQVAESGRAVEITLAADVLFRGDTARLSAGARRRLAEVAGPIRLARPLRVQIDGYTDGKGSDAEDVRSSQARAEAVGGVLDELLGAAAPVVDAAGRGARDPIAAERRGDPAAGRRARARNRRVTVRFER